jgi:hypothetical protein
VATWAPAPGCAPGSATGRVAVDAGWPGARGSARFGGGIGIGCVGPPAADGADPGATGACRGDVTEAGGGGGAASAGASTVTEAIGPRSSPGAACFGVVRAAAVWFGSGIVPAPAVGAGGLSSERPVARR